MASPTLRDWRHASRLFLPNDYQYVPKVKFLYHVSFYLEPMARSMLPTAYEHIVQIGMLVKSVDLPRYTANTKTLNKYNRRKNIQTHISYTPINMIFHDDNFGITRHLLEGYYRYYYADGAHKADGGAYGTGMIGDTTYKGSILNGYQFGLDNENNSFRNDIAFFEKIEISQLSRGQYYMYTLAKPLLTEWGHDNMDYSQSGGIAENKVTIAYEGVQYSTGNVDDLVYEDSPSLDMWENEDSRLWEQPDITQPSPDLYT